MKKEGIMRINSYNKFFAKVAKIMNTSIKAVKQLEGRYKVELANHVNLNVYRGVSGVLFIHDHRGIAHITSCYDFDDFKTMTDLYERLVSDYSESAKKEVMEVKQELNARFGKKEQQYFDTDTVQPNKTTIAKIEKMSLPCLTCKHFCAVFDNERIKMTHCVRKNNENYLKAAKNPNWHNVSLKTLANIDIDMLDEKRRLYFTLYREMKKVVCNARKCKTIVTFDRSTASFRQKILKMYCNDEITALLYQYFLLQLSMLNVEFGAYDSSMELATGLHESRRYNKIYCN